MAFPQTAVLDDFNRSNGALGANWSSPVAAGDSTPTVFSNVMVGTVSTFATSVWAAGSTFLNGECYVSFTNNEWVYLFSRINGANSAGLDCIFTRVRDNGDSFECHIVVNGSVTVSDTTTLASFPGSGQVGTHVYTSGGDIVSRFYLDGVLTRTTFTGAVASYPEVAVAGRIGTGLYAGGDSTSFSLDNFGGGSASLAETQSFYTSRRRMVGGRR